LLAGSIDNIVERNLVFNHERTGIAAVPFPEEDASDTPPPESDLETPCDDIEPPSTDEEIELVLWNATGNRFVGNVVESSGLADLASATLALEAEDMTTAELGNCFSGNTFTSTAPLDLELLAPCDGAGNGGDFDAGGLNLGVLIADQPEKPEKD